jgi:hypothetical protein
MGVSEYMRIGVEGIYGRSNHFVPRSKKSGNRLGKGAENTQRRSVDGTGTRIDKINEVYTRKEGEGRGIGIRSKVQYLPFI